MDVYAAFQPASNPTDGVRCARCDRPSKGYFYCFPHRREHAAQAKAYMAERRKDPDYAAAERVAARERMRRLRAQRRQEAGAGGA